MADTGDASSNGSNHTLVVTLSTVLSVVTFLVAVGAILLFWRNRRHRIPLFTRGVTPIEDEEIERWKLGPRREKGSILPTHKGNTSVSTTGEMSPLSTRGKKPASVIVYTNAPSRVSGEGSPQSLRSMHSAHFQKQSFDVPPTPVFAKAPNARPGLCDEALPGADPFVAPIKRQQSRLSKAPGSRHVRSRSSRSSVRSLGFGIGGSSPPQRSWFNSGYHTDETIDHTPTIGNDYYFNNRSTPHVYSSNSGSPRFSVGEEFLSGLSPPPAVMRGDIGRAIG